MEDNLRRIMPPAPAFRDLTAENPKDAFHRNANDECSAWTNEKHNLYLDGLEASFVDQLQRSKGLRTQTSEQNSYNPTCRKLPANTCNNLEQVRPLDLNMSLEHAFGHHQIMYQDECTAWTNEKHNLYLESLEASFVEQLHRSKGLQTWSSEQSSWDPTSRKLTVNNTLEQKILFGRNLPLSDIAPDSLDANKSPQIHHCRCGGKHFTNASALQEYMSMLPCGEMQFRGKQNFPCGSATSCNQVLVTNICHPDSGDTTEFSDQNFVGGWKEDNSSSELI